MHPYFTMEPGSASAGDTATVPFAGATGVGHRSCMYAVRVLTVACSIAMEDDMLTTVDCSALICVT